MSNETCPHCGAELRDSKYALTIYRCGTSFISGEDCDRGERCVVYKDAQQADKIERLKQGVIDEREACAKLVEDFIETKKGWHTVDLVAAIRARGEVKMNEQKEFLKKEFLDWWYGYGISEDNPYREDSPLYWAWEGFLVGLRVEREACAKVCEELVLEHPGRADKTADQCAAAIRARGEVK